MYIYQVTYVAATRIILKLNLVRMILMLEPRLELNYYNNQNIGQP